MQIKFQGTTYDFDLLSIGVKQAKVVKAFTGMNLETWMNAVGEVDPTAVQALYWAMKAQAGETPGDPGDLDFPLLPFMTALGEAFKAEAAEQAPDPSVAASSGDPTPA